MSKIDWNALYTSDIEFYRSPSEPKAGDVVRIRFRALQSNVDRVVIHVLEDNQDIPMHRIYRDRWFDYFEGNVGVGTNPVSFYFHISNEEESVNYNRLGVTDNLDPSYAFRLIPDFHIPDWIKGTVMYQILVDRFYDGDPTNNVEDGEYMYLGRRSARIRDWNKGVEPFDVHRFYGGDLAGVLKKLDYLQDLGVRVIYFNPLFVSPSNHKYDTQDYEHIDPHVGRILNHSGEPLPPDDTDNSHATLYQIRTTAPENLEASDQFFQQFVAQCHARGIRVIIDGVFNHCGSFNKWMNKCGFYTPEHGYAPGAYQRYDSPYHDYFSFMENAPEDWPDNESYDKWWGNDTLPKLNYEGSRALCEEILKIGRKWVSPPYNCDGWRLDVAADLGHSAEFNHQFWKEFRRNVKAANPDAVILAEHYGDPSAWLQGDEWDTVMNYDAFMEPVTWFLTGMEKHSDSSKPFLRGDGKTFFATMTYCSARLPENSVQAAMNQLSNHDHSRFMTRTNMRVGRLFNMGAEAAGECIIPAVYRLGAMIQMTWPGAPTIYYGDEVGMVGWTEPDSRRTFPWGREDFELLEYHKYLTRLRLSEDALRRGSVMKLLTGHNYIVYARIEMQETAVIVINASEDSYPLMIPLWLAGVGDEMEIRRVLSTTREGYNAGTLRYHTSDGMLRLDLKPYEGSLFLIRSERFYSL